jgi:hypothetical protein
MEKFTDFILYVSYPPNPVRNLDNSLTQAQQAGRDFFFGPTSSPNGACGTCHQTDPQANPSEGAFAGFFGADGRASFAGTTQIFKVPHLRNMYQKIGMFGGAHQSGSLAPDPFLGDQIRGFGFNHDGSTPTMLRQASGFDASPLNPGGIPVDASGMVAKENMVQYQLAFESNLAPIVGQQVTLDAMNGAVVGARIGLLRARADAYECDLVAKGRIGIFDIGFVYMGNGQFVADRQSLPPFQDAALRALVAAGGGALTYTCVPPGSGDRIGIDRDLDGYFDGDEVAAGSDPADPDSTP